MNHREHNSHTWVWNAARQLYHEEVFDVQQAKADLFARLNIEPAPKKRTLHIAWQRICGWSAVACVTLAVAVFALFGNGYREYRVAPGESPRVICLCDDSRVTLNAGSVLRVPYSFKFKKKREAYLQGEALFDVTKNPDNPFTVHLDGSGHLKVYGTVFNVKSYAEDVDMSLSLKTGSVSFLPTDAKRAILLDPGERVVFDRAEKQLSITDRDFYHDIAWESNHLIFDNNQLEDILNTISRKFNVSIAIKVSDISILKKRYSGEFVNNEPLDKIMASISSQAHISCTINPGKIEIADSEYIY